MTDRHDDHRRFSKAMSDAEQVEQLALLFGVEEVSSNLRGVDDPLKALQAA